MAWQVGLAANAVITLLYAAIAVMVVRGLRGSGAGWRDNPTGWATGLVFLSCAFGHGGHLLHLAGVPGSPGDPQVLAARTSYDVHLAMVDVATAVAATLFWTFRARADDAGDDGGLYADTPGARRQALRINHDVVQGIALATYQLELGDVAAAQRSMAATLEDARALASAPFAHEELLPSGQLVGDRPTPRPASVGLPDRAAEQQP